MLENHLSVLLDSASDDAGSIKLIPDSWKYKQNYRIFRWGLDPIDVTGEIANGIFNLINEGKKIVTIGNYMVTVSAIKSIDPLPIKKKPSTGHFEADVWVEE